jgi:cysteine desulfurase
LTRVYLDHAASTPCAPAVFEAMVPWLTRGVNAASAHAEGRACAAAIDLARHQVAALVGWDPVGVVFTSGATEANALALAEGGWWTSAVEHPSALAWAPDTLRVDGRGVVIVEDVARVAPTGARGVSVMLANNETGVVQPIAEVIGAARAHGLAVHVDASQAPGRVALDVLRGADLVTLSAHKIGGPQGVGALLRARGLSVTPRSRGGPQERGLRAGTHAVAAICGFGAAAERAREALAASPRVAALRDRLESALAERGGRVAGAGAVRLPNVAAVGFEDVDAADLVAALDLEGVAVSAGSACASGSHAPSHVLRAMGFLTGGFRGGAVRFSLGATTTDDEIDRTIAALDMVLARLR